MYWCCSEKIDVGHRWDLKGKEDDGVNMMPCIVSSEQNKRCIKKQNF